MLNVLGGMWRFCLAGAVEMKVSQSGLCPALFQPCRLGAHELAHRVVLAPMTRTRADALSLAPTEQTALYYAQRASQGGLVITEATHISPEATPVWTIYEKVRESAGQVPGIWTETQVAGWKTVTEAVHARGGLISCQLLHAGRVAQPGIGEHPLVRGSGAPLPPVSASGVLLKPGTEPGDYSWDQPAVVPRALTIAEIARVVADYRRAARNAHCAGFDFVELHAAHGYLVEQFLCDGTNQREDEYGGNVANRCRFLFEVVATLVDELGPRRVGVRLSPCAHDPATGKPYQTYFGTLFSDPELLYEHAIEGLNDFPLAYLMLTEPRVGGLSVAPEADRSNTHPLRNTRYRNRYHGVLIGAGGFTPRTAGMAVAEGHYDLVAFGRWFLANPDLPERLKQGLPLNVYDRSTFYGAGAAGYTDYPCWEGEVAAVPTTAVYPLMEQTSIGVALVSSQL